VASKARGLLHLKAVQHPRLITGGTAVSHVLGPPGASAPPGGSDQVSSERAGRGTAPPAPAAPIRASQTMLGYVYREHATRGAGSHAVSRACMQSGRSGMPDRHNRLAEQAGRQAACLPALGLGSPAA
jgi:hypothetical protein